jgi:hypothetical protein
VKEVNISLFLNYNRPPAKRGFEVTINIIDIIAKSDAYKSHNIMSIARDAFHIGRSLPP